MTEISSFGGWPMNGVNDVATVLRQAAAEIKSACGRILEKDCALEDQLVLLWGIARTATNPITNRLPEGITQILVEVALKALVRINGLLDPSQGADAQTPAELQLICSLLDDILDSDVLHQEGQVPIAPVAEDEGSNGGSLDLTLTALSDLESGGLNDRDEATVVAHFMAEAQREHRLTAMEALMHARDALEARGYTVRVLLT